MLDSPWATQYNSWEINPHQLPDAEEMIRGFRADGVRTVLWCTPWVNLDSRDGQIPPQPESERLHREPAPNYAPGAAAGHFVRQAESDEPWVGQWWMGTGSLVDFTSADAERWWREQVKRVLQQGVEGIKVDDGDGYYLKDDVRLADGRRGGEAAWHLGGLHRISVQRALDEVHPGNGRAVRALGLDRSARDRPHLGRRSGLGLLVAAGAGRRDAVGGGERHLQLVARRRRLPRAPAGRALPAGAARSAGCSSAASRR